jgi:hypothetical protein
MKTISRELNEALEIINLEMSDTGDHYKQIIQDVVKGNESIDRLMELVKSDDLKIYKKNLDSCFSCCKSLFTKSIVANTFGYGTGMCLVLGAEFLTRSGLIQGTTEAQMSVAGASTVAFTGILNYVRLAARKATAELGIARNLMAAYEDLLIKHLQLSQDLPINDNGKKDWSKLVRKIITKKIKDQLLNTNIGPDEAVELLNEFKTSVMQTSPESYSTIFKSVVYTTVGHVLSTLQSTNMEGSQIISAGALTLACGYIIHCHYSDLRDKSHKLQYTMKVIDIIKDAIVNRPRLEAQSSQEDWQQIVTKPEKFEVERKISSSF